MKETNKLILYGLIILFTSYPIGYFIINQDRPDLITVVGFWEFFGIGIFIWMLITVFFGWFIFK